MGAKQMRPRRQRRQQATGNKQQAAGNRQQVTSNKQQATTSNGHLKAIIIIIMVIIAIALAIGQANRQLHHTRLGRRAFTGNQKHAHQCGHSIGRRPAIINAARNWRAISSPGIQLHPAGGGARGRHSASHHWGASIRIKLCRTQFAHRRTDRCFGLAVAGLASLADGTNWRQ